MVEFRWAENQLDRLPVLAADLVRRRVDAIVTNGTPLSAVMAATSTIPIILVGGNDPVEGGFGQETVPSGAKLSVLLGEG